MTAPPIVEPKSLPVAPLPAWQRGTNAAALMRMEFPPIRYVVPGYIVEGLTVLAGAPKVRKSWMMLDVALAVASGGWALGSIPCEMGDVLYLALEDNQRRLQDRMRKMGLIVAPDNLTLCTEWPLGAEAINEIEAWVNHVENPTLVAIDVLARVREPTNGDSSYEIDYRAMAALQDLAMRHRIAIVVIHHNRKLDADDPFDLVSGTRGTTAAADSVLVLRREPAGGSSNRATLYGRGRDLPEIERALEFRDSNFRWHILGDSWVVAPTVEQQHILEILSKAGGPMKLADIAKTVGKSPSNVRNLLTKMRTASLVTQPKTGWYEVVKTMNPVNLA